jgi:ABC-type multidrug transport system fused ATPase/permease subunit
VFRSAYRSWISLLAHLPSFVRVQDLLGALKAQADPRPAPVGVSARAAAGEGATVELREVGVTYAGETQAALRNINLTLRPGEVVALVGPSGSGKTTLADVCAGVIHPDTGDCRRYVGGGAPAKIGYVGQDGALLPLTLRENLLRSEPLASEADCWAALDLADADFVRDLPDGLDTQVGLTRARFSGGEQKRLLLACALLRDPALLVLDETTSQLDAGSEARIIGALLAARRGRTLLLVTHRLTVTRLCDRIIVLEAGRVTQDSAFEALAGTPGMLGHLGRVDFADATLPTSTYSPPV